MISIKTDPLISGDVAFVDFKANPCDVLSKKHHFSKCLYFSRKLSIFFHSYNINLQEKYSPSQRLN